MKTLSLIETALKSIEDAGDDAAVQKAVSFLLSEGSYIKSGDSVAVIDDPTHSFAGLKAKVKDINGGVANIELANGTIAPVQINLLYKV